MILVALPMYANAQQPVKFYDEMSDILQAVFCDYVSEGEIKYISSVHGQFVGQLVDNVILCLDGDGPGVKAATSIGEELLRGGVEVKVVILPDNDDPDTFILKHGKDRFIGMIENALNFSDFKINQLKVNVDFRSDEEKANYINAVLKETTKIDDEIRVGKLLLIRLLTLLRSFVKWLMISPVFLLSKYSRGRP